MANNQPYLAALADTFIRLVKEPTNYNSATAEELCDGYFSKRFICSAEYSFTRRKLKDVATVLRTDHELSLICLVSEVFFKHFRTTPPLTLEHARKCAGIQNHPAGLYLAHRGDDLIFEATRIHQLSSGAGATQKAIDIMGDTVKAELWEIQEAENLMTRVGQQFPIKNVKLAKFAILPGK